jgi:hypothetical protein
MSDEQDSPAYKVLVKYSGNRLRACIRNAGIVLVNEAGQVCAEQSKGADSAFPNDKLATARGESEHSLWRGNFHSFFEAAVVCALVPTVFRGVQAVVAEW